MKGCLLDRQMADLRFFLYENAAMVIIFATRRAELISRFSIDALPDASV